MKKNAQKKEVEQVSNLHQLVLDEYFSNGLNGVKAVIAVNNRLGRDEIEYQAACTLAHLILKKKANQPYIQEKQHQLSIEAGIGTAEILKELKSFAFADVTEFLDLSPEELKQLPSEVRRTLKKVTIKEKSFKNADGTPTTERTYVYELNDKLSALEKIGRHIGFYEADNKQKTPHINLTKLDNATINNILRVVESEQNNAS